MANPTGFMLCDPRECLLSGWGFSRASPACPYGAKSWNVRDRYEFKFHRCVASTAVVPLNAERIGRDSDFCEWFVWCLVRYLLDGHGSKTPSNGSNPRAIPTLGL